MHELFVWTPVNVVWILKYRIANHPCEKVTGVFTSMESAKARAQKHSKEPIEWGDYDNDFGDPGSVSTDVISMGGNLITWYIDRRELEL